MGEESNAFFEPIFNRSVKLRARGQRISSNGGVILLREADERLGLIGTIADRLHDPRDPALVRYRIDELVRANVLQRALGYAAEDEADLLAHDPAFRIAVWNRSGDRVLEERFASQPTQSRLTSLLAGDEQNVETLRWGMAEWLVRHQRASYGADRPVRRGTLDIDSFPVVVHGSQEEAAYNGYYRKRVYHPIVACFAPEGDYDSRRLGDGFVHARLRPGNVHTADGGIAFIRQAVERASDLTRSVDLRLDAGFMSGNILDALTDDGIHFLGRLKTNARLQRLSEPHLTRPVGRPPTEGYEKIVELGSYKAESWRHAQRLILVVVDRPDPKTGQLELFPRSFFLVTNWKQSERSGQELLAHYRQRGTFEDRLGELSEAIGPRLSSPRFQENEVHLLLSLLSHNLLSILRGEFESDTGSGCDMGRLQKTVLKTAVRVTTSGRRLLIDVALAAVALWHRLLTRMKRWHLPAWLPKPAGPGRRPWVDPPPHAFRTAVLRE